jgi:hypothetical protein
VNRLSTTALGEQSPFGSRSLPDVTAGTALVPDLPCPDVRVFLLAADRLDADAEAVGEAAGSPGIALAARPDEVAVAVGLGAGAPL